MPNAKLLSVTFSITALFCGTAFGHSAMFPDQFRFDNSGEGLAVQRSGASESGDPVKAKAVLSNIDCVDGLAGDYPCRNVDLRSQMSVTELGGGNSQLSDIWGWTDLNNGMEVAIVGKANGTSFVSIVDPSNPQLLGFLPSHNNGVDDWRDIKVYQNHAFIVADGAGNATHGLQIYDLSQLASVTPGSTLSETAHHNGFGNAHNIAIDEDSGYAFVVGANQCSGGLYMVDISTPTSPVAAGCFADDGYTHDAQCVTYQGPDTQYFDQEICIAYNEDTITIVDVTTKSNPLMLSRTPYPGAQYTHQGWFVSDNHTYVVMNDELDEQNNGSNTTSYLWDLSLLGSPVETGRHIGSSRAIDHNLYSRDGYIYASNYRAGLRILNASDVDSGSLSERAYFDTIPCSDDARFSGAWSAYVEFSSGNVIVSDIENGLFVLRPDQAAMANNANAGSPAVSPACATPPTPEPPTPEPPTPEPPAPEPPTPEPPAPEPPAPEPPAPEPPAPEPPAPEPPAPEPPAPEPPAPPAPEPPAPESPAPEPPTPAPTPSPAPAPTSPAPQQPAPAEASAGGGGGSVSLGILIAQLSLLVGIRRRRGRQS